MKADRLLVLAVDLPEMTRAGLTALLTAAGEGGAVFRCGRFLEPLVAVYPKAMAGSGRRRLEDGKFALLEWITKDGEVMRELQVPASEEALFMNVNDPAAWDRWITGEA
jgi:molybdopterin-guanine dinucleotide biosynthesis protein A